MADELGDLIAWHSAQKDNALAHHKERPLDGHNLCALAHANTVTALRRLSALEAGGMVLVPRGSLEVLFEIHLRDADSASPAVHIGAYPQVPYSQKTYVDAWLSVHAAARSQGGKRMPTQQDLDAAISLANQLWCDMAILLLHPDADRKAKAKADFHAGLQKLEALGQFQGGKDD